MHIPGLQQLKPDATCMSLVWYVVDGTGTEG
jgi:hypothetical protein